MSQTIHVAGIQASFTMDEKANVEKISHYVEEAKKVGAQVILPPELFEAEYFCRVEKDEFFALAKPFEGHPTIKHFQKMAKALNVVIPVSFFERDNNHYYNSLTVVNTDGTTMGLYRKSHIPDGPGYEEKFYFRPGNTGFKTWPTAFGNLGIGICWDQWYPECARAMMLLGADILLYPTAIGSEPEDTSLDTKDLWQKAMIGHAVSNVVPVLAANRIGNESGQIFYGHSFVANHRGQIVSELGRNEQGLVHSTFDLDLVRKNRASFGFFRDRRPNLYGILSEA
ncbi:MAG: N-carbamoylputrescine amidase [Bdellovibrionales bacterium]